MSSHVRNVPSLDEWLQTVNFDLSEGNEAELIEHHKQADGLADDESEAPLSSLKVSPQQALAAKEVGQAVAALNHLGTLMGQRRTPLDACGVLFSARTAAQLALVDVHNLGKLHALLHCNGFHW